MRVAAAVLCCIFLALAAWSLTLWSRTRWPAVGLVATITPVAVYSTAVAAPNGIEMCAALAVWCALLGLTRDHIDHATQRALVLASLPGALVLTTVRQLGPMWLLLITATVVLLAPRQVWTVIKEHRRVVAAVVLATCAFTAASVGWMVVAGQDTGPKIKGDFDDPVANAFLRMPVWLIQSIGVFPAKDEFAPPVVYAATIVALGAAFCLGMFLVRTRVRLAIAVVIAIAWRFPCRRPSRLHAHGDSGRDDTGSRTFRCAVAPRLRAGPGAVPSSAARPDGCGRLVRPRRLPRSSAVTHVFTHELDHSTLAGHNRVAASAGAGSCRH